MPERLPAGSFQPPIPSQVDGHRVLGTIGRGGTAVVYEVLAPSSGAILALKRFTSPCPSMESVQAACGIASELRHPAMVRVVEWGSSREHPAWITMERLHGSSAQSRVRSIGPPGHPGRTAEAARIAWLLADVLDALHRHGVLHRDVKSSNTMVLLEGSVKLLDLGTARAMDRRGEAVGSAFSGTPSYASPEQLRCESLDARSDIYSLGVLLYRMLTGRMPFKGGTVAEASRSRSATRPPPAQGFAPAIPRGLSRLASRLLSHHPAARPGSAAQVRKELEALQPMSRTTRGLRLPPLPMVGRHRQLHHALEFLGTAAPGDLMMVSGPEGSGCLRLLRQVARELETRSLPSIWVDCTPTTDLLAQLLLAMPRHARSRAGRAGRARLAAQGLATLAPRAEAPLAVLLPRLDRQPPRVMADLDELQRQISQDGTPTLFLASASSPAGCPATATLQIPPLSMEETRTLVKHLLGERQPPEGLAERLHGLSGALPGGIAGSLGAALEQGLLRLEEDGDGVCRWLDRTSELEARAP